MVQIAKEKDVLKNGIDYGEATLDDGKLYHIRYSWEAKSSSALAYPCLNCHTNDPGKLTFRRTIQRIYEIRDSNLLNIDPKTDLGREVLGIFESQRLFQPHCDECRAQVQQS